MRQYVSKQSLHEASNGGINRAGDNEPSIRVLRMRDELNPLRFNDLLDGQSFLPGELAFISEQL